MRTTISIGRTYSESMDLQKLVTLLTKLLDAHGKSDVMINEVKEVPSYELEIISYMEED